MKKDTFIIVWLSNIFYSYKRKKFHGEFIQELCCIRERRKISLSFLIATFMLVLKGMRW